MQELSQVLSQNAVRVIDLFREWDADQSGTVSKVEFRRALPMLGIAVKDKQVRSSPPDRGGSGR